MCFKYPPALLLQAAVLGKPKHIARNEIRFSLNGIILLCSENALQLEGGYKERNVKPETDLTEPQGKLKKRCHGQYIHSLKIGARPSY